MEFRLLYQGELLPSGNRKTRPAEKHSIRRSFHPQLRRLWQIKPSLREWVRRVGFEHTRRLKANLPQVVTDQEHFVNLGIAELAKKWRCAGYEFVPLVTAAQEVRCSLDILLLRPEEQQLILRQGDLDGQIKTVFDALKLPASDELGGVGPQEDETPFFVLLEDDRLISEVRVNSDQMLLLPTARSVRANDCFAVIHVKLNYKGWSRTANRWLD